MRIATAGDNCIDRYLPPVGQSLVGGNAVNVAVALRRLGHDVHYFGAVGDDADGRAIRGCLAGLGLGLEGLRIEPNATTAFTEIATLPGGEREFVHEEFGACQTYLPDAYDFERLLAMDHVHIGWLYDAGALKRRLIAAGVSVSQDLSVNTSVDNLAPAGLRVAFASSGEPEAEARAIHLVKDGAHLAVVTMGAAGSLAWDGATLERAPALPVVPVDTTGAGDSFIAGFLDARLIGASLETSLRAGARLAREACLHLGGFRQVPFTKGN